MKKFLILAISCLAVLLWLYAYYYNRWKFLWQLENPRPIYSVLHHDDDTLRVVMIGDSWIELHKEMHLDTMFERQLSDLSSQPVKVNSKGKGLKRSRGIYDLMYKTEGYGTKPLIESGANYCVISAGLNDAGTNLGTYQFCYYMRLIFNLLLANGIIPVVFEVPDVNYWKLHREIPIMFVIKDYMRSIMTGSGMYHYAEYREALNDLLMDEHYQDSVVYINVNSWNGEGYKMNESLFLDDQIHLNLNGYRKLDSCLASFIVDDYYKRFKRR